MGWWNLACRDVRLVNISKCHRRNNHVKLFHRLWTNYYKTIVILSSKNQPAGKLATGDWWFGIFQFYNTLGCNNYYRVSTALTWTRLLWKRKCLRVHRNRRRVILKKTPGVVPHKWPYIPIELLTSKHIMFFSMQDWDHRTVLAESIRYTCMRGTQHIPTLAV